jgi:hypothetical protein
MQGNQDKFNNNVEITINQIIQIIKLKNSITPGSIITTNNNNNNTREYYNSKQI